MKVENLKNFPEVDDLAVQLEQLKPGLWEVATSYVYEWTDEAYKKVRKQSVPIGKLSSHIEKATRQNYRALRSFASHTPPFGPKAIKIQTVPLSFAGFIHKT